MTPTNPPTERAEEMRQCRLAQIEPLKKFCPPSRWGDFIGMDSLKNPWKRNWRGAKLPLDTIEKKDYNVTERK